MFCPALKPVLTPVARGVQQACSGVVGDVVPLLQELFTDAENDTGFTNTRATPQHVETDTGALYPVPAGAIPIRGARPVRNLAASSDTPSTQNITVVVGHVYAVRIGAESASGATAVCSGAFTGTLTGDATDIQTFTTGKTATTTTLTVTITGSIRKLQVQDITHRSALSTAPDEYVDSATDHGTGVNGFRYFTTALANTVDGSGVVTEGTGAALTGIALANRPGATNLFDYSTLGGTVASVGVVRGLSYGISDLGSTTRITGTGGSWYISKSLPLTAGVNYTMQLIARRIGGTDQQCRLFLDDIVTSDNFTITSDWQNFTFTGTALFTTSSRKSGIARNSSNDDADIEVAYIGMEVGTVPTAVIPTSGSTASTDAAVLDFSGVTGFTTPNETRVVATGLNASLEADPTDTTERNVDADDWDGTDLSDLVPHGNIISVTQYAPGDRP